MRRTKGKETECAQDKVEHLRNDKTIAHETMPGNNQLMFTEEHLIFHQTLQTINNPDVSSCS